jgi:hypothetical protein
VVQNTTTNTANQRSTQTWASDSVIVWNNKAQITDTLALLARAFRGLSYNSAFGAVVQAQLDNRTDSVETIRLSNLLTACTNAGLNMQKLLVQSFINHGGARADTTALKNSIRDFVLTHNSKSLTVYPTLSCFQYDKTKYDIRNWDRKTVKRISLVTPFQAELTNVASWKRTGIDTLYTASNFTSNPANPSSWDWEYYSTVQWVISINIPSVDDVAGYPCKTYAVPCPSQVCYECHAGSPKQCGSGNWTTGCGGGPGGTAIFHHE